MTEMLAVDPDVAVVIDAVELNPDLSIAIGFSEFEMLAIPADTAGANLCDPPPGASLLNGPSMLQSCGSCTLRQARRPSSLNCQSKSNVSRERSLADGVIWLRIVKRL